MLLCVALRWRVRLMNVGCTRVVQAAALDGARCLMHVRAHVLSVLCMLCLPLLLSPVEETLGA